MDTKLLGRKNFRIPALVCLSVLVFWTGCSRARPARNIKFIALSDTHIAADSDLTRFRSFLYSVRERGAAFVIVTGDVCEHAPEYEEPVARIAASAPLPVYLLPGNHDDNYGRNPEWWSRVHGRMQYAFDSQGYTFVMNWSQDSLRAAAWLDSLLGATPVGKTLICCQHYPPPNFGAAVLPLLQNSKADIPLCISGHRHTEAFDTLGPTISLTLENCSMGSAREGRFYEIELHEGRLESVRSFEFDSLALEAPPDSPPTLALDDTSLCLILDRPLALTGRASDDRAVASVGYSLDRGDWLAAGGDSAFSIPLDPARLGPGHHELLVRARDNAGNQSDGFARAELYVPEPEPHAGTVVLWNGRAGYDGCRDVSVSRLHPDSCLDGRDLECRTYGPDGEREFSEFYIRYDLRGMRPPRPGARLKSAQLVLFCCRQVKIKPGEGDDLYRVGLPGREWDASLTFATRPADPGWTPADSGAVEAGPGGEWREVDGRVNVSPEATVSVDLGEFIPQIERWLASPGQNRGWIISPLRKDYSVSFRSGEYGIASLRPRLRLVFE